VLRVSAMELVFKNYFRIKESLNDFFISTHN
jgi:hypothetical protein